MPEKIRTKQLELLYSHLPIALLTGITAVIFISVVLWDSINPGPFIIWLIVVGLILLYRLTILLLYRRQNADVLNLRLWDRLLFFGTLLTGFAWGSLALFYSPDWRPEAQISLWVLIIALMSGASASFAVSFKYYIAYCGPVFLFAAWSLISAESYYMAVLLFFFTLLLSLTSINFHKAQHNIIAKQLELQESNILLESLASKDALTNLPNRRAFEEYFSKEWARHVRSEKLLSLMMIDVDYFKNYNDHYGHDKGDECLRHIADVIEQSLRRPSDKAARFGGEEFIILLPETPTEGAIDVAERIHENLRDLAIEHEHSKANNHLTVSIGIATLVPQMKQDAKFLQVLADRELYKAKASGRNCTSYNTEEN